MTFAFKRNLFIFDVLPMVSISEAVVLVSPPRFSGPCFELAKSRFKMEEYSDFPTPP